MTLAYDAIAGGYDAAVAGDRWMRRALWGRYLANFDPGMRLLDIGCGTGIDAVYLARKGLLVDGFDSSPAMLAIARKRAGRHKVAARFRTDVIDGFQSDGVYDGVISGFAALNTVEDLRPFSEHVATVLRPGGRAVLHLVNRYSAWEWLGGLRHGALPDMPAIRTFRIGNDEVTHYVGTVVATYHSAFETQFRLSRASGYGFLRPPHTVRKVPDFLVKVLGSLEAPIRTMPPFRDLGRFFILELERR